MQVNNELNAGSVLAGLSRRDDPQQGSGRSEFLQLMIAQLKNQDPLDPQNNGEFLSQLAQFSSLESMQNLEKGFDRLSTSLTSGTALQAASLVGREVVVAGDTARLGTDGISGQVQVPAGARQVSIDVIDATGTSIGKGYAGVIKRHHFRSQDATHGNSLSHRAPGSIGQNQTPGRVFKGKRMAGHLGNVRRTVQNLRVVRVDPERGLLLVRGAVPGPRGGDIVIRPAAKARR